MKPWILNRALRWRCLTHGTTWRPLLVLAGVAGSALATVEWLVLALIRAPMREASRC